MGERRWGIEESTAVGGGRYNSGSAGGGPWRREKERARGSASGEREMKQGTATGEGSVGRGWEQTNRGGRLALTVAAGPLAFSVYRLGPEEINTQWNPSRKKC
jgi:hypothetical protein